MSEAASTRKLSRKERELQFRVGIVLDAAEQVFSESSYAAASVEEIARRAEISVGTLYNLFDSKEEIYTRVVSRAQGEFFEIVHRLVGEARGPAEKIRATIDAWFEHITRHIDAWRLYVSASNGFQWELKSKLSDEASAAQAEFLKELGDICQAGIDKGVFKPGVPAELLALGLMSIPHGFLVKLLYEENPDISGSMKMAAKLAERLVGIDVE